MAASSNVRPQLTAQALILSVIEPTLQSNPAEFAIFKNISSLSTTPETNND